MPVVNRIRFCTSISKTTNDTLNEIAEKTNVSKSRLIDLSVELLKEQYKNKRVGF